MKFTTELMTRVHAIAKDMEGDYSVRLLLAWEELATTKEVVLAELEGSEKQIKWASDIRIKMLSLVSDLENGGYELRGTDEKIEKRRARMVERTEQVMNYLMNNTSAKWFIDNRELNGTIVTFHNAITTK